MDSNIDANVVIQKLQSRLGEAMTIIAVLESRLEAAQQHDGAVHHEPENPPEE